MKKKQTKIAASASKKTLERRKLTPEQLKDIAGGTGRPTPATY